MTKSKLLLAVLCLLAGFVAGWAVRAGRDTIHKSPRAEAAPKTPEPAAPASFPPLDRSPPDRPPEFYGVVERLDTSIGGGRFHGRVDMRCVTPSDGRPLPTDPYQRDGQQLWLAIDRVVFTLRSEDLRVGAMISVWHKGGGQMRSKPPGYIPDYIHVEKVSNPER